MLRFPFVFLLTLALFLTSCGRKEKEPNNDFESAEKISASITLKASIDDASDTDFFYIAPKENSVVDIEIENKDLHFLDAYLYKDNRILLEANSSKTKKLFKNYGANGLYLKLSSVEKTDYAIKVVYKKASDFESEPNDSLNEANPIEEGRLLKGDLKNTNVKDIDFFRIKRNSDKKKLSLNVQVSSTNNVDIVLKLYDLTGNLVETFDKAGIGQGESIGNYILNPPYDYYLSVSNKNFLYERTIPYEILVQTIEVAEGQEYEPNDSPQTATEISEDAEEFIGYVNRDNDEDYYKIEFKKGLYSNLNLFITPPPGVQLKVAIVDAFNNTIASPNPIVNVAPNSQTTSSSTKTKDELQNNEDIPLAESPSPESESKKELKNSSAPSNNSSQSSVVTLQNFHITNPVYYLYIKALGHASLEPYRVKMYYRNYERPGGIEQEPNETIEQANVFSYKQTVKGLLNSESDVDFFKFEVPEKKSYVFNFLFPKDVEPVIVIYREEKKIARIENDKVKDLAIFESVDDYNRENNKITFKMKLDKKFYGIGISYAEESPVKNNEFYYLKVEGEK